MSHFVGKPVTISEASIRSDLLFDDANGIDSLNNQAIFDAIQLMGYEGDLTVLTFNKALFSPQWRFLFHTMNHCLSSKSAYWDQILTNIATALKNVLVPLDHFPVHVLTSKVFSFMVKKGKHFSGKMTPLFPTMLVQPTEDEGEVSERPSKSQPTPSPPTPCEAPLDTQPDPSPRPSPSIPIPDPILKGSGGNQGDQSSSDRSQSGNEDGLTLQSVYDLFLSLYTQVTAQAKKIKALKAWLKKFRRKANPLISHHKTWVKSVKMKHRLARKESLKKKRMQKESVSKQGRKSAKSAKAEPYMHKDQAFDDFDGMDYMETDAYKEDGVSTEPKVSTDKPEVSTNQQKVSTDKVDEGTAEPRAEQSATPTTPTTTSAPTQQSLEMMKQLLNFWPTSTRSVLTLKPLPKIDPKDKGKKVLKEETESDAESEGVNEAEKKFKQLANDEEMARKFQEEWEAGEEKKRMAEEEETKAALSNEYDFIQARINADRILAEELQKEEREQFTIDQRTKFLHDTIAAQRRFPAKQRSEAIRNKPPTRSQLRNQMMTYLKHVGNKKHVDLKTKSFEEIQVLYEKVKRFDDSFIAVDSAKDEKQIKEMNEEAKDPKKKRLKKRVVKETLKKEDTAKVPAEQDVTEQGTKKRKSGHVKMIARKRPRPQPDDDSDDEHRKCLRIITFDSTIDSEVMETKSLISKLHKVSSPDGDYLVVYRANGHFRAFN
ncbi:hypothetical protein Tco_0855844 [Tanacetum coccineum]